MAIFGFAPNGVGAEEGAPHPATQTNSFLRRTTGLFSTIQQQTTALGTSDQQNARYIFLALVSLQLCLWTFTNSRQYGILFLRRTLLWGMVVRTCQGSRHRPHSICLLETWLWITESECSSFIWCRCGDDPITMAIVANIPQIFLAGVYLMHMSINVLDVSSSRLEQICIQRTGLDG